MTCFAQRKGVVSFSTYNMESMATGQGDSHIAFTVRGRKLQGHNIINNRLKAVHEIDPDQAADIELVWTSGDRYDMGPTIFEQERTIVGDDLLENLVYWEEGEYYHQGRLDRLRTSLTRLDYFGDIEITPEPENAVDRRVPVNVRLTPAKRSIYTAGLSYGTDSGAGVRLGVERRYVNLRGHKALAQLDYAQKRKTLTLQYRIPAFAWRDGWYTFSAQAYDEQTDYIDTRRVEFVASRSGQFNRYLNLVASVHALRERWLYAEVGRDGLQEAPDYRYATFTFPSLRAEYVNVDDRVFPRSGVGGSLTLRSGALPAPMDFLEERSVGPSLGVDSSGDVRHDHDTADRRASIAGGTDFQSVRAP
mgnify:CR=1 FL=1